MCTVGRVRYNKKLELTSLMRLKFNGQNNQILSSILFKFTSWQLTTNCTTVHYHRGGHSIATKTGQCANFFELWGRNLCYSRPATKNKFKVKLPFALPELTITNSRLTAFVEWGARLKYMGVTILWIICFTQYYDDTYFIQTIATSMKSQAHLKIYDQV